MGFFSRKGKEGSQYIDQADHSEWNGKINPEDEAMSRALLKGDLKAFLPEQLQSALNFRKDLVAHLDLARGGGSLTPRQRNLEDQVRQLENELENRRSK